MWEHGKQSLKDLLQASGGEYQGAAEAPDMAGTSLHETGTLRMGSDPAKFVTNRFGQTHDVPNLYVCDASLFPNCTDKTTTISILAFSLRASEHLLANLKSGQ
jgi:choline dehydrogenase-like flavoprotein